MKHVKNVFIGNALFLTIITVIDFILGKYEYFFLLFLSSIYLIIAYNAEKAYTKFINSKLLKLQLTFLSNVCSTTEKVRRSFASECFFSCWVQGFLAI